MNAQRNAGAGKGNESGNKSGSGSVKNWKGQEVKIPDGHIMSSRDPDFSEPPIYREGPYTDAQRNAFLQGKSGDTKLECLDTDNIVLCETKDNIIEKMEGEFKYKLRGKLIDMQKGIVEVKGFNLHIDEDKIPKDMLNGMCIQFEVSRIDIW